MKHLCEFTKRIFSGFLICWLVFFLLLPNNIYAQGLGQSTKNLTGRPHSVKDLTNVDETEGGIEGDQNQNQGFRSANGIQSQIGMQMINVHVLGDVANPGVYKINVSDRAADIVKQANPNRIKYRILQIRHPGEKTTYYDLYRYHNFGDLSQNPYLKDNDVIFVPKPKGTIKVEGPVERPGLYELWGEKNLDQIINLVGGFTDGLSKMYPVKVIRFSDGGEKFVLDVVQKKDVMKRFKIRNGDIVIVPDIINAANKFDYNVETIPGEHHVYPTAVPDVFVIGAVQSPGPYPYRSHLTIKDYLGYSGASADANFSSVKVIRDGKRKRQNLYAKVQAGDVIIVKQKAMNEFLKYVGIASTLMSVTLSVIVLKDYLKD